MSWIDKLQKTYDNSAGDIGVEHKNEKGELKYILFPVCHTSQNAQIDVILDGDGDLLRASIVPKDGNQQTILPATEGSAGRTGSRIAPLSLGDKLQYIAGDYEEFGGKKKPGFDKYISRLKRWADSSFAIPQIKSVLVYLQKRTIISDLIEKKILSYDEESNSFPEKWNGEKEERPGIFSVLQGGQLDCLVRFSVEIPGVGESHLWKDSKVWGSWNNYYLANKVLEDNYDIEKESDRHNPEKKIFCYVEGKDLNCAGNHPAKIRNTGDGAKLISSNDTTGFTYLGRFLDDEQACTISYEVSQKAHNALRWLIAKQGYRDGNLAVVAWAPKGVDIPNLLEDSSNCYADNDKDDKDDDDVIDTAEYTGKTLASRIAGYSVKLGPTDDVVVMGINSATTGRLSVSFYRELIGVDFLTRVENWHTGCAWRQRYSKDKIFYGAPAPKDIAWAAYGTKLGASGRVVDDKIKWQTIERLLPCIIDGISIPSDIVKSLVREASKRVIHDFWEWEKILGIACAVIRHSDSKEDFKDMALIRERKSRDYLYGRLLAVADGLEKYALKKTGQERPTNATRLMQRFALKPYSTWLEIELKLQPYIQRLGDETIYSKELREIEGLSFDIESFTNDRKLEGEFLLGFHSERAWIVEWIKEHSTKNKKDNSTEGEEK